MHDLTTQLANYALTCDGKAEQCRRRADEIKQRIRVDNDDEYNRVHVDRPLKDAMDETEMWTKRAAEARRGFLLYDPNDVKFHFAHQDLIDECMSASRVTYVGVMVNPAESFPAH